MEDDDLGAGGDRDAGRVVEHPDGHVRLLVALAWPMKPTIGAWTDSTISASRASSPKRSAHG